MTTLTWAWAFRCFSWLPKRIQHNMGRDQSVFSRFPPMRVFSFCKKTTLPICFAFLEHKCAKCRFFLVQVQACEMTTKISDNRTCKLSKFLIVMEFPKKSSIFGQLPPLPPIPNSLQNAKIHRVLLKIGPIHCQQGLLSNTPDSIK